ncbi:ribosomal-protein-alanine acetyltransferase [Paenibacillus montaniterrae]|uniref:Ribosomal-protein-alanine acetyltransferase n=1 Tax=Paenibacillus montaniterrae TaxID=429341 RepID=A0A919YM02_9BACL|nr:ribosomal protein S18-alanine N-acetyltransferase [Paenibacillus montaniterrae]GIP16333.1 ribosomal-protein-alanine acetyltransferase [Paenibacillus montaniterrae]
MGVVVEKLVFRKMTLDDLPSIMKIEQDSFATPWTEEAFRNELTNNMFAQYMVMEYEGEVIGYAGMWIIVDEAHITNVAILTPYRGQGLGKLLMAELQRTASFLGAVRMTLEVRASNEIAQRLYRRYGFVNSGVRPGYYSDNQEDAIIMWADVPQLEKGDECDE